jgi:hypothetical protein
MAPGVPQGSAGTAAMEPIRVKFLGKVLYTLLLTVIVLAAISQLDIRTTSI